MSATVKSFFLLWLLVQPLTSHASEEKSIVVVTNKLQGGRDLILHCKSADDDLGVQHLHPNAYFVWSFEINFFVTTLFHCSFQWESVLHKFDLYKASRDVALGSNLDSVQAGVRTNQGSFGCGGVMRSGSKAMLERHNFGYTVLLHALLMIA
ncbi:hypothetical protein VNO80_25277 [Phaseolus coccineus]|uniref:S-protein homolog n=1 Tax=Phaseolus coccineus TaxID=3886 RepID=A0AAN9LUG8_PHACN